MFDGVPFLLGVASRVRQIHLAESAGSDFSLNDKRFAQFPERLVFRSPAVCRNTRQNIKTNTLSAYGRAIARHLLFESDVSPAGLRSSTPQRVAWVSERGAISVVVRCAAGRFVSGLEDKRCYERSVANGKTYRTYCL